MQNLFSTLSRNFIARVAELLKPISWFLAASVSLQACDADIQSPVATERPISQDPVSRAEWNIPADQIISSGVPKDGIPALTQPRTIPASEATYLSDENFVVGIVVEGKAVAYPYSILDWHEVVNHRVLGKSLAITYCPLTGSAIAFEALNGGRPLVFGVSGLLYNSNLIMYDRELNSHWPQMRLQCDQGELRNTKQIVYPSLETSWGTWKKLFPESEVLSDKTSHDRPYHEPGTAYPDYDLIDSPPLYPLTHFDDRLPPKQKVHGLLFGESIDDFRAKVYLVDKSHARQLIHDSFENREVLIIDCGSENFVVSFLRTIEGNVLSFEPIDDDDSFPFLLRDGETESVWNVLGECVAGPLVGKQLQRPLSFNAYWFAWGAFYLGSEIFTE